MQPECDQSIQLFRIGQVKTSRVRWLPAAGLVALLTGGCEQNITTLDRPGEQPFQNQQLQVSCSFALESAPLVEQYAREWQLTQAVVPTIRHEQAERFTGDVAIVTAAELPKLAESGRYLPVPDSIVKNRDHPFHWDGLLPSFAGPVVSWGGVEYGLPLMGEGHVLVYRKDRLKEADLKPPAKTEGVEHADWSWDDYLSNAKALTKPGRPALPPLSTRAIDLDVEFHLIAASYDRQGLSQSATISALTDVEAADRVLSYHYRLKTGETRINSPAFVEALRLLRELQAFRTPGEHDDPASFFANGSASLAIVSLRDLYRLQAPASPVRGKFGVAPFPGARFTFGPKGEHVPIPGGSVNRMPYLGARSWVGLVSKDCPNPDMAWAFLAGLAIPDKMGAEVITAGKWGAGPFRYFHIEERGRFLWFGYDLPREDTENLIVALKDQLQPGIVNPCYVLRLPNEKAHAREFDNVIRQALNAKNTDPQTAMNQLAKRWNGLWKDVPDNQRRSWVRKCYGLSAQ